MSPVDPDDSRAPYRQLFEDLRFAISIGTYNPGDKLPSYETTAREFGVAIGTAKRAYAALQQDGIIVTRPGLGSYVRSAAAEPAAPGTVTLTEVHAQLREVLRRLDGIEERLRDR